MNETLFEVVEEFLRTRAKNVIRRVEISDITGFLAIDPEDLLELPNCGNGTIQKIREVQSCTRELLNSSDSVTPDQLRDHLAKRFKPKGTESLSDNGIGTEDPPSPTPVDDPVYGVDDEQRILDVLLEFVEKRGRDAMAEVNHLADFLAVDPDSLKSRNCGYGTIEKIRIAQNCLRKLLNSGDRLSLDRLSVCLADCVPPEPPRRERPWKPLPICPESELSTEAFDSFKSLVLALLRTVTQEEREIDVMLGKMGWFDDGHIRTENELESIVLVGRGRIGQIYREARKQLELPEVACRLRRFWDEVTASLGCAGGKCTLDDLSKGIASRLRWDRKPSIPALRSILSLNERFDVNRHTEIVSDRGCKCLECESVIMRLRSLFAKGSSERSMQNVVEEMKGGCDQCDDEVTLSPEFIRFVAPKASIRVADNVVYPPGTRVVRRGTPAQQIESILKDAGRPMRIEEVCEQAKRLLPNDPRVTLPSVRTWVETSPKLFAWDRGVYIHRSLIEIPDELIAEIECRLQRKLAAGLPVVSVAGIYEKFSKELSESSIPSYSALYSCLRISNNDNLHYPRYPYVVLPGRERIEVVVVLEEFVRARGSVTLKELKSYAVDELWLSEQQFVDRLSHAHRLVRTADDSYVYVEEPNSVSANDGELAHDGLPSSTSDRQRAETRDHDGQEPGITPSTCQPSADIAETTNQKRREVVEEWSELVSEAIENGDAEEVRRLLDGCDLERGELNSLLVSAAFSDSADCLSALIEAGADPNCVKVNDLVGMEFQPLWTSVSFVGRKDCIQVLLEAGSSTEGISPLLIAGATGDRDEVVRLLDSGEDVNAEGPDGSTALHLAAKHGRASIAQLLLDRGADIDSQNDEGDSATMLAPPAVLRVLLRHKPNLECRDQWGLMALHKAVADGSPKKVDMLVKSGADVNAKDDSRRTPLEQALRYPLSSRANDYARICSILRAAGAEEPQPDEGEAADESQDTAED